MERCKEVICWHYVYRKKLIPKGEKTTAFEMERLPQAPWLPLNNKNFRTDHVLSKHNSANFFGEKEVQWSFPSPATTSVSPRSSQSFSS